MDEDLIIGFIEGIVKVNEDPEGLGRVKVLIPGLIEPYTSYWIKPACWPGAGGKNKGSQYPIELETQVYVMFKDGIWDSPESSAIYLTGFYGVDENEVSLGPVSIRQAADVERARKRCCLWENAWMAFYVIDDADEQRVVIETKETRTDGQQISRSRLEIGANAGESRKAQQVRLEAGTVLTLYCEGLIDIEAGVLQLNGRTVLKGGGPI